MLTTSGVVIVSLFLDDSVLLVYPLQSIDAQSFETNSTQGNVTGSSSPMQWVVYTNDRFGFSIEYPQSWIIEERKNRFESGSDLVLGGSDMMNPNWGQFIFSGPEPAATNNIRVLTNLVVDGIIGGFDADYEKRLIERANVTKYTIDGERAGVFTYVLDSKDFVDGETTTTPVTAVEFVSAIHDGKSYYFSFTAGTDNFDNPTLTDIRQHMFNSIKWLG